MRRALVATFLAALLLLPASAAGRQVVRVKDNFFSPSSAHVSKGERVVWKFRGDNRHNVHVTSGPRHFTSDTKRSGRFRKKMRKRGTYSIVCTIHAPDMRMTLTVG